MDFGISDFGFLGVLDFGILVPWGSWEFGIWGFSRFWIWGFGDFGMLRFVDFEISENFVICSFSDSRVLRVLRFWDFAFFGFRFVWCF